MAEHSGDLKMCVEHAVSIHQAALSSEGIAVECEASPMVEDITFDADQIHHDVDILLKHLREFLMEGDRIMVSVKTADTGLTSIVIINSGLPLHMHSGPINRCTLPLTIQELPNGTRFELRIPSPRLETDSERKMGGMFYADLGQRLRSYFKNTENLIATLRVDHPKDAAFLEQVNKQIEANLEKPQFDANRLADLMNLSRAQLFRRLKPIIQRSTAKYIRMVRLQRAKELLETTDLRVNEVASKTGFETASNFTKIFTKQFGMNPSMIGRNPDDLQKG